MRWDIRELPWDKFVDRVRSHYGEEHFPVGVAPRREFEVSGDGSYDLLPSAGVFVSVRRGDLVWYTGSVRRDDYKMAHQHRLFEYGPALTEDNAADVTPATDADELDADEHRPDDPGAIAPLRDIQLWLGEVQEVFSMEIVEDGVSLRRTYLGLRGFATGGWLKKAFPTRWRRIQDLIVSLHPREHVKTDLWEFCRAHDIVAKAAPVALDDSGMDPLPPLAATDTARAFVKPGVVHFADDIRNGKQHRPLEFRTPPAYSPIACEAESCAAHADEEDGDRPVRANEEAEERFARAYRRGDDEMARCPVCLSWFHVKCLKLADPDDKWSRLRVQWNGGRLQGPPTRREPNLAPAEFLPAARDLWVRADPPVRTWGRAATAVSHATTRAMKEIGPLGVTDGLAYRALCASVMQRGDQFTDWMTETESAECIGMMEGDKPLEDYDMYKCGCCNNVM
ncbi:unnamed protein product [Peniophora sp. CBMAI 1063]|nr:unnamed protein product [Peniophora sp. CBMAI 1063]